MNKVYQVIVVSKTYGIASVIPSPFAFTFEEDAMQSIRSGINTFEQNGEKITHRIVNIEKENAVKKYRKELF